MPYYRGYKPMVFMSGNFSAANTPLVVLTFQFIELVPYKLAILIFLLLLISGVIATAFWGAIKLPTTNMAVIVFAGGLSSIGVIAGIDRGNWIVLFVPLVLMYCVALQRDKQGLAIATLTVMSVLKFWGIILVVGLLAKRRYRAAATTTLLTLVIYAGSLSVIAGSWNEKIRIMFETVTDRSYGSLVSSRGVSFYSFIVRINCLARDLESCDRESPAEYLPYATVIAVALALVLSSWAYLMIRKHDKRDDFLAYAPLISLVFLAIPEAFTYNLAVMVAIISLFNRFGSPKLESPKSPLHQVMAWAWIAAITFAVLPIPVSSYTFLSSPRFGEWRMAQITVPLTWTFVVVITCLDLFNRDRDSETPLV